MVEQIWTDETSRECQLGLAQAWSLASDGTGCPTVRGYSAQASRALHARARDDGGRYATLALQSLAHVAQKAKNSPLPGDKGAAVTASKELLKYAGLAEPEEDKQRPTTLVQVGQVVTSPVFAGLLAGKQQRLQQKLNGESGNGTAHQSSTEESGELSARDRLRALVRKPSDRD